VAFLGQRGTKHEALNPYKIPEACGRKLAPAARHPAESDGGDGRKMSNEALEREPIDRMRARLEVLLEGKRRSAMWRPL